MPINVDSASEGGFKVFGDGGEDTTGVVQFKSAAATTPALTVGRTVAGNLTSAAMKFLGSSIASGALMQFDGGFISCTSVVLSTVANIDYMLPVVVGPGNVRYIPLVKAAGIIGGATFPDA